MKGGPRGDVDHPAVAEAAAARSSSPAAPGLPLETFAGYSRETSNMRVYEPKEAAVAILERQLALNRREIASARASTQQQPGSNGVLGSASAGGFPGDHTRATEEKSAQARELYRMHRLHLLEQRKLRQQQRELSGSQQQQQQQQQESQQPRNRVLDGSQQQQNGVLDGAALVRLLNGGLSQLGSLSEQQQQLRPREQEHHQQEQEQRVSGEDPEEALDDAKKRLEAEVAMWKGKAETSLKSYRTLLHQAQAAHRKNLIQAVENNSLASERDEMEARNVAVVKDLHETRQALVEVKAELRTLKTLHAIRHQHEQQRQHQQQQQQQRRRSSSSLHASPLRSTPSARQQRLRQEILTPQAEDPRTPTTTTTRSTTAPSSPPPYNARDSGGAASLLSSGAAARRRRPETAGPLPTRTRPAAMFGRVSAPATVPMGTRRQTAAAEAFATAGGGVAWSGSGEDGTGERWGGDREGPAVPLPHEHDVPYCHPRASSAVALRRRLMEAGGERSKDSRGAATTGVYLREDGFPVGDEGRQVAYPPSRDGGRDKRQQQLHEQQQTRHGYLHQRQQRRHSDTGIEDRELWQAGSEERRPYGW